MRDIQIAEGAELMTIPMDFVTEKELERRMEACRRSPCGEVYDFSSGESPFPVPQVIVDALKDNAHRGRYCSHRGIPEVLEAIAGFTKRHYGLDVDPSRIIVSNGTTEAMHLLFTAIKGHVLLPSPSWPGYLPLITLSGKDYHLVPTRREDEYKVQPDHLDHLTSRLEGDQHLLVINSPHNPTGMVYSRKELEILAEVCREHNILVLADELYALLTYDPDGFTSMGAVYPEGTFITNGMSKDRSAAGWRFGHCILPEGADKLMRKLSELAAAMYSNVSTPTQYAAVVANSPSEEIDEYMANNREIYRMLGAYVVRRLKDMEGVEVLPPKGGFYVLADLNRLADKLSALNVVTSGDLANLLIDPTFSVATVKGEICLLDAGDLSLRLAFVDLDGAKAIARFKEQRPRTSAEEREFVETIAPHVAKGMDSIGGLVESLGRLERPLTAASSC